MAEKSIFLPSEGTLQTVFIAPSRWGWGGKIDWLENFFVFSLRRLFLRQFIHNEMINKISITFVKKEDFQFCHFVRIYNLNLNIFLFNERLETFFVTDLTDL